MSKQCTESRTRECGVGLPRVATVMGLLSLIVAFGLITSRGFGDADWALLDTVANDTGGGSKPVSDVASPACELQRKRSPVAGVEPSACTDRQVDPGVTADFFITVPPSQRQATFSTAWVGSDVVMTLSTPFGRAVDKSTTAADVAHAFGPTFEVYGVQNPEAGKLEVSLFGADVPPEGKDLVSGLIAASRVASTTVYLPMLTNNLPPPVFGVQMEHAIDNSQGLAQATEAGVHWVRFSAFHWDKIEPVRTEPPLAPTYLWQNVDEQSLLNAAAKSMEVIAIVQFTPDWAQKVSGKYCGPIREDRLDEFAQFLQALVSRYSAAPYNVRYWELGNEPDIDPSLVADDSGFGCWGDNTDPYYGGRYYAEMLKVAYPAIKAADPEAQVLIGGLLLDCDPRVPVICTGIHGDKPPKFLEGILRNGGGPYFDIVSFHAYAYFNYNLGLGHMGNAKWPGSVTAIPEKTGFLREVLAAYGYGEKELMNTESALLCGVAAEECLETQTMYVPRAYAEALALELRAQTYYALINEDWRHTGLLLPDLTPKPVYHAYRTASSFLTSVRHVGAVKGYPVGIEGYTFRRVGNLGYLEVIWSADGSAQSVSLPAGASVYDRYGTLIASSGTIPVDYSPVYVARP